MSHSSRRPRRRAARRRVAAAALVVDAGHLIVLDPAAATRGGQRLGLLGGLRGPGGWSGRRSSDRRRLVRLGRRPGRTHRSVPSGRGPVAVSRPGPGADPSPPARADRVTAAGPAAEPAPAGLGLSHCLLRSSNGSAHGRDGRCRGGQTSVAPGGSDQPATGAVSVTMASTAPRSRRPAGDQSARAARVVGRRSPTSDPDPTSVPRRPHTRHPAGWRRTAATSVPGRGGLRRGWRHGSVSRRRASARSSAEAAAQQR
jgi:hypothetical protein